MGRAQEAVRARVRNEVLRADTEILRSLSCGAGRSGRNTYAAASTQGRNARDRATTSLSRRPHHQEFILAAARYLSRYTHPHAKGTPCYGLELASRSGKRI